MAMSPLRWSGNVVICFVEIFAFAHRSALRRQSIHGAVTYLIGCVFGGNYQ
jgi:hypothetical protein